MRLKRLAAAAAATVLATLGLAGAANADPVTGTDGTLTIHKYKTPAGGPGTTGGDGTATSGPTGATPLPDIEFSIQQVLGVNLNTNQGWADAKTVMDSLTAATNKDTWTPSGSFSLGTATTDFTDSNGEIEFGNPTKIPVGLYLVKETGNVAAGSSLDPNQIQKTEPFLVTIPMADPATAGQWNYDVHVFPKNTVSSVSKTVDASKVKQIGDEIEYTITTSIPVGTLDKYEIEDNLPTEVGYKSITVELVSTGGTTTLATPGDYSLTAPPVGTSGLVKVVLTAAGWTALETAKTADANAQVVTTIVTTALQAGDFTNNATFWPDSSSSGISTGTGTNPGANVKLGGQKFKKVDDAAAGLAGAVFEVYSSPTPDFSTATKVPASATTPTGPAMSVTSGTTGQFSVDGLRVSDWDGNQLTCPATGTTAPAGCIYYWLVETTAPTGYVALAQPVMFTVDDLVANSTEKDIVNVSEASVTGTLPLTGMGGIVLLVGLGALVLASAGYGMYRVSRTKA